MLSQERIANSEQRVLAKNYCSGHMIYIDEQNAKQLSWDIKEFIKQSL